MSIKVCGRSSYVNHCVMADEELEFYGVAVSTIAIVVSFVQKKRHKNVVLNSGSVAFFNVVIKEVLLTVYCLN